MKRHLVILFSFLSISVTNVMGDGVLFNEVMTCNISSLINTDNYNFSGYIEFKNTSASPINLKSMVLTHYKKKGNGSYELKWEWVINKDFKVLASDSSYSLLWMDESDVVNHAPYKLDADGGYLTLRDGGVLVDSFAYNMADAHISYGRYENEVGYMQPSPGVANTFCVQNLSAKYRCESPIFSQVPGILADSIALSITSPTVGATIYYTLDGSEPTDVNGIVYSQPIRINKNSVVRARAYASGMLQSKIFTGTYIFSDAKHADCGGFSVPIVSLSANDEFLNDDMIGMLITGKNGTVGEKSCNLQRANYNHDWKRAVNFEYIVDGKQVLSQEVEAGVEGGCSRSNNIKSLSLKASKKTGKETISYNVFHSKPDILHRTLHLRNGGQGFSGVRFKEGLMSTFAIGLNIDYQAYQPVAYYLNGEYLGLMGLRERTNADYVKSNYGYDDDEIDLVTISDQLGISANRGTLDAYNALVDYLSSNDPAGDSYFRGACELMDMDEYIDYQILQQFLVNVDWPGNNTKMWREKESGRFRWIMFDTDYGLGHNGDAVSKNMIEWCQAKGSTNWGNNKPWMTTIFANLSQNKEFKKRFVTRYLDRLNTHFSEERINTVFDSICAIVQNEYCATRGRDALSDTKTMRDFALGRPSHIYDHLTKYVEGDSMVNLEITSNVEGAVLLVNGEKMSSYNAKYISGWNLSVQPYAPAGYRFLEWRTEPEALPFSGEFYWESVMTKQTEWKYYYDAQAPDSLWYETHYDDTAWDKGAGRFGFNSGVYFNQNQGYDVVLDYGPNSRKKHMTAYFRSTFTIKDIEEFLKLQATITYDDGYVLYINGVEVEQTNMRKVASIAYSTEAASNVNTATRTFNIDPALLVNGENSIAVEVHLNKVSSSNLTFDFELKMQKILPVEEPEEGSTLLNILVQSNQKVEAVFEKVEELQPLTLQFNEICASSDKNSANPDGYGKYPDWIEIYNYGIEPCDLAGLYISDDANNPTKCQIPYGFDETIIYPNEHKLFWAKGELYSDPFYLDFKLSLENPSAIILSRMVDGELEIVDYLSSYEKHPTNASYGLESESSSDWVVFDVCSVSESQATPLAANGSKECEDIVSVNPYFDDSHTFICYPNPTSSKINIQSQEMLSRVSLFDLSGALLYETSLSVDEYSIDLSSFKRGIYILEVESSKGIHKKKIIKE